MQSNDRDDERQEEAAARIETRNGVALLPVREDAVPVTPELVNQLRDELP